MSFGVPSTRSNSQRSVSRTSHGLGGKEFPVDGAHVDIPAFALRRVRTWKITGRHQTRLHIDARCRHNERPLKWIDCNLGVWNRAVAVREQIDLGLPELALAVVAVDVRIKPGLPVDVDDGFGLQHTGDALGTRRYFHNVLVAHLPIVGTRSCSAVGGARLSRGSGGVHASEHVALADELEVVLLEL